MQSLETLTELDFDSVWEIMEESFPRDERRSREAQRKILDVSWYHLYGYRAHGELMAFLAVWEFDTFLFVEHFAVRKSCRNGRTWSGTSDTADDAEQKAGYTGGGTADR